MWLLEQLSQKFLVWPWPWALGKTIHIIWVTPAVCPALSTALIWQDLVENTKIVPTFIYFNDYLNLFLCFEGKILKLLAIQQISSWILNLSGSRFFVPMQVKTWSIFKTISRSQGFQFRWLFLCEKYQQTNTATGGKRETLLALEYKNIMGKLFVQRFSGLRKHLLSQSSAVRIYHTRCCFQTVPASFMRASIPRMNPWSPGFKSSKKLHLPTLLQWWLSSKMWFLEEHIPDIAAGRMLIQIIVWCGGAHS